MSVSTSPPPAPHPLYNTTYTLHTLTPLHNLPAPTALAPHARRLLNQLRASTLRGVDLAPANTPAARTGALQQCTWTPLPVPHAGLQLTLAYEHQTYAALFLGDGPHYPLLLTRMPAAQRAALVAFLAAEFDTLPLPLALPDALLRVAVNCYVGATRGARGGEVALSFAPRVGAPALKRVAITVASEDVHGFWQRGESGGGFLGALGAHLEEAVGLRVHEVDLVKVALGGFVLASEGKAKFCAGDGAVEEVIALVMQEAAGRGKWGQK